MLIGPVFAAMRILLRIFGGWLTALVELMDTADLWLSSRVSSTERRPLAHASNSCRFTSPILLLLLLLLGSVDGDDESVNRFIHIVDR